MISLSAQYALRAIVHIANHPERHTAEQIAVATGIPLAYLPKVLAQLVRGELVLAQRGKGGGYALARPAKDIRMLEVVRQVDRASEPATCGGGCHDGCLVAALLHRLTEACDGVLADQTLDRFQSSCCDPAGTRLAPLATATDLSD